MINYVKMIVASFMVFMSFSSFASAMNSDRMLQGGTALPNGGTVKVVLSGKVINEAQYDVSCRISKPSFTDKVAFKVTASNLISSAGKTINGQSFSQTAYLTANDNVFTYNNVAVADYAEGSIIIQDLDNDTAIKVDQCVARIDVG